MHRSVCWQTVLCRQDADSNPEPSKEEFKVMLGWLEGLRQEQIDAFFDFIAADHHCSISEEEFDAAALWVAAGLGALTGLRELDLLSCARLTALPAELGALTGLRELNLFGCSGTSSTRRGTACTARGTARARRHICIHTHTISKIHSHTCAYTEHGARLHVTARTAQV